MGGCRLDERLKPLLKQSAIGGATEDQFMTQLVQYFEASEVAVLARCLCVPLVSVRVGKITKQGNMLYPTALRGFLSLTLLPSSHMRISFTGDDGFIEKLAVVGNDLESASVIIEGISADTSGRSFLLKFSDSRILFFWCSEKSKGDGMELIVKMKDLLGNKPSLSGLTGISKCRLDSFATHLRDNMLALASTPTTAFTSSGSQMASSNSSEVDLGCQSKTSHVLVPTAHAAKSNLVYQTSLSPRSNAFKDGNIFTRKGVQEKKNRWGDSSINVHLSTSPVSSHDQSMIQNGGKAESHGLLHPMLSPLSLPLFSLCPTFAIPSKFSSQSSFFSPYYCWCPPCPASLQYSLASNLPNSSEFMPLPPLSTLLSSASPPKSLTTSKYSFEVTELPSLKLPASLLPDPLLHFPMPISSICSLPCSQQIATFTPFMSDPIVHLPMIDICSSGQGYLFNAGPSISASHPPLPINLANHQLIPPMESLVEKNARETLRVLMASTPTLSSSKLLNVFPVVLSSTELYGKGTSVPGNGDLFKGTVDVQSINCGISSLKFPSSIGDTSRDVLGDRIECNCPNSNNCHCPNSNNCHCPNTNNCQMSNTETEEL
ncbi:hypothetical protein KSP39_PZI004178 [Platanthera zijinensis]|uniref:Uncharacterized protein n=1 Tax=Platanthera zijinensis TaxID=2320716 RepID=A0AAP0BXS9_9ASPA